MSPSRPVWNSWSQMLMSWAGEHGEDVTILSLRSDRLGEFWRGFHRCGGALWVIWQGCVASNGPGKCAQSTFFALKDAQESGTGHSRLSLLCRVLAEGVSAPSARKFSTSVKLEMDPDQNPQMISKRDRERSRRLQGRGLPRRGRSWRRSCREREARDAARRGGAVLPSTHRERGVCEAFESCQTAKMHFAKFRAPAGSC